MKTYRRLLMIFAVLLSAVGFSFNYNPCDFASNNILFIKEQTEQAISADDINMAKYYAYKALDGIWNAQYSFNKCGCEDAITNMELVSKNLKEATKATSFDDAKTFLQIAMKSTRNSVNAITDFKRSYSKYGYESLSQNTTDSSAEASENPLLDPEAVDKIEAILAQYQKSVANVIKINDCLRAQEFINDTQRSTQTALKNPRLSLRKQYYHHRVLEIMDDASKKLEKCTKGNHLLARK